MTTYLDERKMGSERVDSAFEDQEADRRHDAFVLAKRERHQAAKEARRSQSLQERYDALVAQLVKFSTPGAASLSRSSRSSEIDYAPQHVSQFDIAYLRSDEVLRRLQGIWEAPDRDMADRHLEALEDAVDNHRGLSAAVDFASMHTEDKDRLIIESYVGFTPEEVSELQPELGKPRAIRYVRRRQGFDEQTGGPRK
jgi:hypothetical protein